MNEAAFLARRDVSRETLERLRAYQALLGKWNPAINLVARSTLESIWDRHFLDSAQIYDLAPRNATSWADLGSGGGFPGLVVGILATGEGRSLALTLVESDRRKAAFLETVARETGVPVTVASARAEDIAPLGVQVLSARALAPLPALLALAQRHLAPEGTALFPKGATHAEELRQALEGWRFSYDTTVSLTDPASVIYRIRGIARA
jgi:16S rRNA (guanine527-N7)-methyltransferase